MASRTLIDISHETVLRIGAKDSPHEISWDLLKEVGDKFQQLVQVVAKYSMSKDEFEDIGEIKLDFTGFYNGSAMPAFKLSENQAKSLYHSENRKNSFISDFSSVLNSAGKGNYEGVINHYGNFEAKRDIIMSLYNFSHSAANKPITFVKKNNSKEKKYDDVVKIKAIANGIITKLNLPKPIIEEVIQIGKSVDEFGIYKVGNKTKKKKTATINDKDATTAIKADKVETATSIIYLKKPIFFEIHKEGKGFIIENEQLELYAAGASIEDAKMDLFNQFEYNYHRLNELGAKKLGKSLNEARLFYNLIVASTQKI